MKAAPIQGRFFSSRAQPLSVGVKSFSSSRGYVQSRSYLQPFLKADEEEE